MSTIQIKVLHGINQNAPVTKSITLFVCMKAFTTAGHIKDYSNQIEAITSFAKCAKSDFEKDLKHLEKVGFITIDKGNIHLASWNKVALLCDIDSPQYHIIEYDPENKEHSLESLLNETFNINKKAL